MAQVAYGPDVQPAGATVASRASAGTLVRFGVPATRRPGARRVAVLPSPLAAGEPITNSPRREAAEAGMPCALTLHEMVGVGLLTAPHVVYSCENPEVMAVALERFGVGCPPLVCTQGWPSTACVRLLRALVTGGA